MIQDPILKWKTLASGPSTQIVAAFDPSIEGASCEDSRPMLSSKLPEAEANEKTFHACVSRL